MASRPSIPLLSLLAAAILAGGCLWNGFADWEKKAPVQAIEAPDDFTSQQFGVPLLVLHHPDHPRTLVVGGKDTDVLGLVRLNEYGNLGSLEVARVALADLAGSGDRKTDPVQALVQLDDAPDGSARVLVGVPEHNYVRLVTLPADGPPQADPERIGPVDATGVVAASTGFGGALAVADLDGSLPDDWVIAAKEYTVVFYGGDGNQAFGCPAPAGTAPPEDGQLVAARFFEADGVLQAVVRGAPQPNGTGAVYVHRRLPGGGMECPSFALSPPPGVPSENFGASLAAADVNGDHVADLAVGIPAEDGSGVVALYLSEGPPGAHALPVAPTLVLHTGETGARSFATRVAWVDLDGDGAPELAVSDPDAPYGPASRGRVHLFGGDFSSVDGVTETVVGDRSEKQTVAGVEVGDVTRSLGRSLAALDWQEPEWPGEELVTGATGRILIFFRTTWDGDMGAAADPR